MKRFFALLASILAAGALRAAPPRVDQSEILYHATGASETALGTASAAAFDRPAAALANPAGLAVSEQVKLSLLSGDLIGHWGYAGLSAGVPTAYGVLGLSGRYWYSPLHARVDQAFGGGVSWAKSFTDDLHLGLAFKYHQVFYDAGARQYPQFGLDAGALYLRRLRPNPQRDIRLDFWSLGAAVQNLGNFAFDSRTNYVGFPFLIRAGAGAGISLLSWYRGEAYLDLVLANVIDPRVNVGLRNTFDRRWTVEAGYQFGNDLNHVAFGVGYLFSFGTTDGRFGLTVVPQKNDSWTLSAGVDLAFGDTDTQPPKIELDLSEGQTAVVPHFYISPNYDGVQDTVRFNLRIRDNRGLDAWRVEVKDASGRTVRRWQSEDIRTFKGKWTFVRVMTRMFEKEKEVTVPPFILWDGTDDRGAVVPDGLYTVSVTAEDRRGNTSEAVVRTVAVDSTPPKAEIRADLTLFSPDGDGNKDTLTITQRCEGDDAVWQGRVLNDRNETVRSWSWEYRLPDSRLVWDGRDNNNRLAPNGVYTYVLSGRDRAGNSVERRIPNITLSTDKQAASVDADLELFSPNSDGRLDTVTFRPFLTSEAGLESWELVLLNEDGQPVRSFRGTTRLTPTLSWDGTDANGRLVRDGLYFYRLKAVFANGNRPESFAKTVTLDTTPPAVDLSLAPELFSPDGDGRNDRLVFSLSVNDPNGIRRWTLTVRDENGRTVRTFSGEGNPAAQISWDGLKEDGTLVRGGEVLTAVLEAVDNAENRAASQPRTFRIDTTPPEIAMTVVHRIFSPDGDGEADVQSFTFTRSDRKTLAEWSLTLLRIDRERRTETPVKSWKGTVLPPEITWDGLRDDGTLVRGGEVYRVLFTASDPLGNRTELRGQFAVDTTPPLVELRLFPTPFSPDGDGENDTLTLSFLRRDRKRIADWSLDIRPILEKGPGAVFKRFQGTDLPPALTWNGIGDKDELVESAQDYLVTFTCRDPLGNTTVQTAVLPVDILVIPTPYGLMIKISTIKFEYNSAELRDERSLRILDRVARILQRYRTYKVQVDGHTDNIGSQAFNLDLSERRARTVLEHLVRRGVSRDNLRARGHGFSRPVADNATEEGRAKNRRVEFLLYKSGEWPD